MKSALQSNQKGQAEDNKSLDLKPFLSLYSKRKMLARVEHTFSYEEETKYMLVMLQEFTTRTERIASNKLLPTDQVSLQEYKSKTSRKRKNGLGRKKSSKNGSMASMSKKVENKSFSNGQDNRGKDVLVNLYIFSAIIFVTLSVIFGIKIWERVTFMSIAENSQQGIKTGFETLMHMGKISHLSKELYLLANGIIFKNDPNKSPDDLFRNSKNHFKASLYHLRTNFSNFEKYSMQAIPSKYKEQKTKAFIFNKNREPIELEGLTMNLMTTLGASLLMIEISDKAAFIENPKKNEFISSALLSVEFVQKNAFQALKVNFDKLVVSFLHYTEDQSAFFTIKAIVILGLEALIYLISYGIFLPLYRKSTLISRKMFIFFLSIKPKDLKILLKSTNGFLFNFYEEEALKMEKKEVNQEEESIKYSKVIDEESRSLQFSTKKKCKIYNLIFFL